MNGNTRQLPASERLNDVRERLRTSWERVAAQAALLSRSLPRIATLRTRRPAIDADLRLDGATPPVRAEAASRRAGGSPSKPVASARSLNRVSRSAASPRREVTPLALHDLVESLRAPFLRFAGITGGAAPSGRSAMTLPRRGRSRLRGSLEALAAATRSRVDEGPSGGVTGVAGAMTDVLGESFVPMDASAARVGADEEAPWREIVAAQQELAAAVERLTERPAAWNQ